MKYVIIVVIVLGLLLLGVAMVHQPEIAVLPSGGKIYIEDGKLIYQVNRRKEDLGGYRGIKTFKIGKRQDFTIVQWEDEKGRKFYRSIDRNGIVRGMVWRLR